MTRVKVMPGMKTNANTHFGHHGQFVIVKRKPSYDNDSCNAIGTFAMTPVFVLTVLEACNWDNTIRGDRVSTVNELFRFLNRVDV